MSEETKRAEIQRLSTSAAELQAELALRPTRGDLDDLTARLQQLQADIAAKDALIESLRSEQPSGNTRLDKETSTDAEPTEPKEELDTGKISAEIDEMFRLDYEEEDDTDSLDTEVLAAHKDNDSPEESAVSLNTSAEYVKLPDDDRLQVTLANGSLHALEEELVRAKEKWAEANAEKAKLAEQLATLQVKPTLLSPQRILAVAVPIVAVAMFWLLLPYIS